MELPDFNSGIHPEIQGYWDAASEGKLLVGSCKSCGERHYYPRRLCPFCFGEETELEEAAGTGKIYSFTVNRNKAGEFVLAYITLDEGPTILTRIIDSDPAQLSIGATVKVQWTELSGRLMPVFSMKD